MALMRDKVLLPVLVVPDGTDEHGKPQTKEVPDLMGHEVRRWKMTVSYHDCMKVVVEGEAKAVAALKAESLAYWAKTWGQRSEMPDALDVFGDQ